MDQLRCGVLNQNITLKSIPQKEKETLAYIIGYQSYNMRILHNAF